MIKELQRRIRTLSAEQRQLLARRLVPELEAHSYDSPSEAIENQPVRLHRLQLVGYYVPAIQVQSPQHRSSLDGKNSVHIVEGLDECELTGLLKHSLPDYMHPARWVALSALPKLPNGKVDSKCLPLPANRRHEPDSMPSLNGSPVDAHSHGRHCPAPAGNDHAEAQSASATSALTTLASILGELLGVHDVRADDNFFELGGDSITAIQFVSQAREAGVVLDVASVSSLPTMAALAEVQFQVSNADAAVAAIPDTGPSPLTPIQRWFFSLSHPQPAHWNLGGTLHFRLPLDTARLSQAIRLTLAQHPALGSRFSKHHGVWNVEIPADDPPESVVRTYSGSADDFNINDAQNWQMLVDPLQHEFELEQGWMLRFLIVEPCNAHAGLLIWVAHHLIMDTLSTTTLFTEITRNYRELERPTTPVSDSSAVVSMSAENPRTQHDSRVTAVTAGPSISMRDWAHQLQALAETRVTTSAEERNQSDLWPPLSTTKRRNVDATIDSDFVSEINSHTNHAHTIAGVQATEQNTQSRLVRLDTEMSKQLLLCNAAYGTGTHELLLCALGLSLCEVLHCESMPVDVEHHGRDLLSEKVDTSGSIGWFTSYFPIHFTRAGNAGWDAQLKMIKERFRTSRVDNSLYLLDLFRSTHLPAEPALQGVLFNYQGDHDIAATASLEAPWHHQMEHNPCLRAATNHRSHALEINAWMEERSLCLNWRYVMLALDEQALESLLQAMQKHLQAIIDFCAGDTPGGYTPSDFPDVDMSQDELDEFLKTLD